MSFEEKLDHLRTSAEQFAESMNREYYLQLSGQKADLEIVPIFIEHSELFEEDTLKQLSILLETVKSTDENLQSEKGRQLLYLWQGAVLYRTFFELGMIEEEQNNLEAALEVDFDGKPLNWRQLDKQLRSIAEREKRITLVVQASNSSSRFLPIRQRMVERAHTFAKTLGFKNYCDLSAEVKSISLAPLLQNTATFLAETKKVYDDLFDGYLDKITPVRDDGTVYTHDMQFFLKKELTRVSLPADGMIPALRAVYDAIGVQTRLPNLKIDLEVRKTKTPRAYCLTPRVPGEVILMVNPSGTVNDYRGVFHEGGHSLHYVYTDAELPLEYRVLGDNTITETWAFLSESLFNTYHCLGEILNLPDNVIDQYLALIRFEKLLAVRSICFRIQYEIRILEKGKLEESDKTWFSDHYMKVLNYQPHPWSYMFFDPALYSAQYFQAWILEAQIRNYLVEAFQDWNKNHQTGRWLISQWKKGQRLKKEELARETGARDLDVSDLLELLNKNC